jgi:alginate O-acetyltransferase complex protein AlgI
MRFDSFQFAIFFPIVVALFWCTPQRLRWVLLLVSSYYFYMCWRPPYAILLVVITAIDFVVGLALARATRSGVRRAILLISLAANLGILFVFKYYAFVANTLSGWQQIDLFPNLAIVLPIGLSFHTFQSMGYAFDVYRRKVEPERHWGTFATFIVFFPQLVAGPIERAGELLPQLHRFKNFDYDRVTNGLKLMAWGLFKKVVVADRLATLVDPAYANPGVIAAPTLVLATVAFGYQIYCDFSGYTDIAIGSAEVLGIRLRPNFRAPYHSRSLQEFWTRWHMSLSTWFRDYVYIPLGGNRVSPARWALNILIVFVLSGVWHGANWTFLVWGIYHGVLMIAGRFTQSLWSTASRVVRIRPSPNWSRTFDVARTFFLVTVGWVLFRASSIHAAGTIFYRVFADWESFLTPERVLRELAGFKWQPLDISVTLLAILVVELGDTFQSYVSVREWLSRRPLVVRWAAYYSLLLFIQLFGHFNGPPFIYFQF